MLDTTRDLLQSGGIEVDELLDRCMDNDALAGRLLKKFSVDPTYSKLVAACAANDSAMALEAAHTQKGLCGNLALGRLFRLTTRQVELLRANDSAAALALMPKIDQAYNEALTAIQKSFS